MATSKKKTVKKFPEKVYVTENLWDQGFYTASMFVEEIPDENKEVGIYVLLEVKKVKFTPGKTELE